jgi:hypothetical protein
MANSQDRFPAIQLRIKKSKHPRHKKLVYVHIKYIYIIKNKIIFPHKIHEEVLLDGKNVRPYKIGAKNTLV